MYLLSGYDKWCIAQHPPSSNLCSNFLIDNGWFVRSKTESMDFGISWNGAYEASAETLCKSINQKLRISGSVHLSASSRCSTLIGVTGTHPVVLVTREVFESCWCELYGLGAKQLWSETLVSKVVPSMGILSTKRLIDRMYACI